MPAPVTSKPIAAISPSRLGRLLACPLRIAFEQRPDQRADRTTSTAALVGLAVHRTLELCLGRDQLDPADAWNRACDELAASVGEPRSAPNARRARLRLERRLPELRAHITQREPTEVLVEHELRAPDGSVGGTIDLLVLGARPWVVDYKTGAVSGEDGPLPGYERQLAIYAWLVEQALGVEVNEAALLSLRQGLVPVDVSRPIRARILSEALQARESFNLRSPGPQPATPSDSSCAWCPFVGECEPAWDALAEGRLSGFGWGEAARGVLLLPVMISASGLAAVSIEVHCGSVDGPATVVDIPSSRLPVLAVGDHLSVWGVTKRADTPLTLAWREGRSSLAAT